MGIIYRLINKLISIGLNLYHRSMVDHYRAAGILSGTGFSFAGHVRLILHPDSRLYIGRGTTISDGSRIIVEENLSMRIGENCYVSHNCVLSGGVTIGSDCLVGSYTVIVDSDHRFDDNRRPIRTQSAEREAVTIGGDVWIGSGCYILKGSKIGSHSIIGANTTVRGEVPEWSIVTGPLGEVRRSRPK